MESVKIGMISLGCAKNLVNSEQMLYLLRQEGYDVTGDVRTADVAVLNTCGFIESAKTEAIDTILELGELKKTGAIKKLIVAGCLAERYKTEILAELPEIDAAIGVGSFCEIVKAVKSVLADESVSLFGDITKPEAETKRVITTSPAWAYLKIAEGCDNRCSYCVIPDIRGPFRSRGLENILAEARNLADSGIKELIVVAQDITRYGLDLYGERRLAELIEGLCAVDGIMWIRLHYMYPDEIDDRLIDVIAKNDKVLKYLDIPIQHISDKVLTAMGRRGTSGEIKALFKKLRERLPGVVLRTSLITGHPGEDEEEFSELCDFLRESGLERAGVFPYSSEEGTVSAEMPRVSSETAAERAEYIASIQAEVMDEYNDSRLDSECLVLIEGIEGDMYYGRSFAESPDVDGYIYIAGEDIPLFEFVRVKITDILDGQPVGTVCRSG